MITVSSCSCNRQLADQLLKIKKYKAELGVLTQIYQNSAEELLGNLQIDIALANYQTKKHSNE